MVPAVQEVVRQQRWRGSTNPIGYIRTATRREARRLGLHQDDYKHSSDRRCPCGAMTRAKARERNHQCVYVGGPATTGDLYAATRRKDNLRQKSTKASGAAHARIIEDAQFSVGDNNDDAVEDYLIVDLKTRTRYYGPSYLEILPNHLITRIDPVAKLSSRLWPRRGASDCWVRRGRQAGRRLAESRIVATNQNRGKEHPRQSSRNALPPEPNTCRNLRGSQLVQRP
jgi:hypothetical protein